MKKAILLVAALTLCNLQILFAGPKAPREAQVVQGNARFTVLTDRLIRLEWAEGGNFEDRASLAIINRELEVPSFKVSRRDSVLTISTGSLNLQYKGSGKFSEDNLSVGFKGGFWRPGMDDKGNLKGTIRTLDGCKGFRIISRRDKELENGILSRDGWALVDESGRPLFSADGASDWENLIIENPAPERTDWYLFAYGHDYKAALADYAKVAGRVPMPPKYTFGYWWSRYWAYSADEMKGIASDIRSYAIPSDVFVIDMGWHKYFRELWPSYKGIGKDGKPSEGRLDEFGQRLEWTGYSWERNLIPNPEELLSWLHSNGFKTTLNLHPASGIRPFEDCYPAFREDYLSRTSDYDGPKDFIYPEGGYQYKGNPCPVGEAGGDAPVPFRIEQKAWADAYFGSVIRPMEAQGVDFWWLDWQQWLQSKYSPSISNTFLCNYMFWQDKVRQGGPRPLIYHRWGGMGSHRYQLGFSGDCYEGWESLQFIPYFTATASNVLYGYWGHDIGGHMLPKGVKATNPELYTRWMQSAVFTPIFKTHSTESRATERKIWMYPSHFEYLRDAIRLRYVLSPYIYSAARETFDTGVCICRPMYYEYPEARQAYDYKEQYLFGPDIIATAVCEPLDSITALASRKIWLPKGNCWYDMGTHTMLDGGTEPTLHYAIDQNAWYVREGAVLPIAPAGLKNLQDPTDELRLLVIPGKRSSEAVLYEDDGISRRYETEYSKTTIRKSRRFGALRIEIGPREGSFEGMLPTRKISVVLEGVTKNPSEVLVNGKPVEFTCEPAEKALSTDAIAVSVPRMDAQVKNTIVIR